MNYDKCKFPWDILAFKGSERPWDMMVRLGVFRGGAQTVGLDQTIRSHCVNFNGPLEYLCSSMPHIFVLGVPTSIERRPMVLLFGLAFEAIQGCQGVKDMTFGILTLPCQSYFMTGYFLQASRSVWFRMNQIL